MTDGTGEIDEAHPRIDRYRERSTTAPLGFWAVVRRDTGRAVGSVLTLELPNAVAGEVEVGWHLHPTAGARGTPARRPPRCWTARSGTASTRCGR